MTQLEKVLLVDDDPTQLIVLSAYFTGLGCAEVLEASSAKEALGAVTTHGNSLQLIVSDLMMPDMDGIEMLRALKTQGFKGDIALISSLEQNLIDSVRKIGSLHGLNIVGTCRKPLTRAALDDVFHSLDFSVTSSPKQNDVTFSPDDVKEALERSEFLPHYQPKVDVLSGRILGVEALARWQHPEKGVLSPALFMPIIEADGLCPNLTLLMFKKALADLSKWHQNSIQIKMAVNVTAREVADLEFPSIVHDLLKEAGIDARSITIEITENEVLEFNATSVEVLTRLRLMGIDIAIDDFGTGYSNLKTLQEFPYTEIKIDQVFIRGMTKDSFAQEALRVAATLGRQLNMRVVAEGVETADELEFVKQRGIDEVQGYFIAKPMPAEELTSFFIQTGGKVNELRAPTRALSTA